MFTAQFRKHIPNLRLPFSHGRPGEIAHLATMMSVVQKWTAQGSEVTLHSVETDENGGVMIAVVDGLMVYAEVPIR